MSIYLYFNYSYGYNHMNREGLEWFQRIWVGFHSIQWTMLPIEAFSSGINSLIVRSKTALKDIDSLVSIYIWSEWHDYNKPANE